MHFCNERTRFKIKYFIFGALHFCEIIAKYATGENDLHYTFIVQKCEKN